MGLFSNNKKLCPICGAPTPRLLATNVEDMPLCKDCAGKIDMQDGLDSSMTLDAFKKYIACYDENQPLREKFHETYRHSFGLFSGVIVLDEDDRLLRVKSFDGAFAFQPSEIKGFRITEDGRTLMESQNGDLLLHNTDTPQRARDMAPQITQYLMQKRDYEHFEQMERLRGRKDDESRLPPAPSFDLPAPVQRFNLDLTLDHPYWHDCHWKVNAPDFNRTEPDIAEYIQDYRNGVEEMHKLALRLIRFMNPGAKERPAQSAKSAAQAAPAAPAVNAVEELPKYKALLDAGVITEEEFAAKKRQLLGI